MSRTRWVLATLILFVAGPAVSFADEDKKKNDKAKPPKVAHISLSGPFDESPSGGGSLFSLGGDNFADTLDRIRKAKQDKSVKALALDVRGLGTGLFGYGKVNELRRAIADFRSSGKKAYAYAESAAEAEYLVAAACDVVVMPESGDLGLTGLRLEMMFLKGLFEKVGVEADFLRMGDYKSAAEQFTRTSMSEENREQYTAIVNDLFENTLVKGIVESRPAKNWTPEQVTEIINNGPYTATKAHELGLIDRLAYPDEFEAMVKEEAGDDGEIVKKYGAKDNDIDMSSPLAIFKLLAPEEKRDTGEPKIAVVYAIGAIQSGKSGADFLSGSAMGSQTMVEAINKANDDETVKAIVLRVDSPGGSALASDLIWRAIGECDKPVIASMGDVAGSGGYYICMSAEKIFAEPGTLTGSIGVVGGKFVTKELFDWAGIGTDSVSRGKNAGMFSTDTRFSDSERKAVQTSMEEVYDQFLDKALAGRKAAGVEMTRDRLKSLAGGRVYTGRQAKEHGLIDELGTLDDAIAAAKTSAGIDPSKKMELLVLPKGGGLLDSLLEGGLSMRQSSGFAAIEPLLREFPQLRQPVGMALSMMRSKGESVWLMMPGAVRVR